MGFSDLAALSNPAPPKQHSNLVQRDRHLRWLSITAELRSDLKIQNTSPTVLDSSREMHEHRARPTKSLFAALVRSLYRSKR
jgi:hypothetical protein